jgi:hypothetical protein
MQQPLTQPPDGKCDVNDSAWRDGFLAVFLVAAHEKETAGRRSTPEIAVGSIGKRAGDAGIPKSHQEMWRWHGRGSRRRRSSVFLREAEVRIAQGETAEKVCIEKGTRSTRESILLGSLPYRDAPQGQAQLLAGAQGHHVATRRIEDLRHEPSQPLQRIPLLREILVPVIDAAHAGMTWPRTRSAMSLVTPARLISDQAVRRKSCNTHGGMGLRLSAARSSTIATLSAAIALLKPEKGNSPFVVGGTINEPGNALVAKR